MSGALKTHIRGGTGAQEVDGPSYPQFLLHFAPQVLVARLMSTGRY